MDATDTTKLQMYQFNMSIKVRFREDRMPGKLVRVSFFIGRFVLFQCGFSEVPKSRDGLRPICLPIVLT